MQLPGKKPAVLLVLVCSAAVLVLEIVFPIMPRVRAAAGRSPGGPSVPRVADR